MGLPTVAFDTPVSREYLGTLGTYAAPTGDPAALAAAMESLLEAPVHGRRLGRKLRERVGRHFSWEQSGRQLMKIYRTTSQRAM
jgi:glycosyltransferase involved in cell wall biosynthesis